MANRYIRAAGGNYNAAGTWELTAGGGESVAVPTASDDVIGTALSGQLTVNATAVAKTVDLSLYTNTVTHNAAITWTVSGNVTFGTLMTYTIQTLGSGTLAINASGTLTTAGKAMTNFIAQAGTTTLGDNLTFSASKGNSLQLFGSTLDMNGKTISGDSVTNRILVRSNTLGTARSITNFSTNFANADFRDINPASGSHDLSGITGGSGDCGGNSANITFTTPATQTATGNSANWSTTTWTSRVPLPQDDVVLSLTAGQTLTNDMPRMGKSISVTTAMNLTLSLSTGQTIYGGINFTNLATLTRNQNVTMEGRSAFNMTSAGQAGASGGSFTMAMVSGSLTLLDAFVNASTFTLSNGTLNAGTFNFTTPQFVSSASTTRGLNMGSGTWTINQTSGSAWNVASTGLTFDAQTSTILLSNTGSSAKTFTGGGLTYKDLTITGGGTGAWTIAGSNTFSTFTIGSPKTITFTSGTTQTITDWVGVGTAGNLITLNASTPGSAATIAKTSSIVEDLDYLSITDINVTPASTWYYGNNSTYVSGTGWNSGAGSLGGRLTLLGVG